MAGTAAHAPKVLKIVLVVLVILIALCLFDNVSNSGKAYSGVHIGEVDVSGLTADEIETKLADYYNPRLASSNVNIYRSADAQTTFENGTSLEPENADLMSLEEQRAQRLGWNINAESVGASLDTKTAAQEAITYAHGIDHFFDRLGAQFFGYTMDPVLTFGTGYTNLVDEVNATMGVPRVDFNIAIETGVASVTEGSSGQLVDDATFKHSVTEALLSESQGLVSFIAVIEDAPVRIDRAAAENVANIVNNAIASGVNYVYQDATFNVPRTTLGTWISTKIEQDNNGWVLTPYIDASKAKSDLQQTIQSFSGDEKIDVSFSANGRAVTVYPKSSGSMPAADQALTDTTIALFNAGTFEAGAPTIQVQSMEIPSELSFDEALDIGLVTEISLYTTTYTYGTSTTESRNFNIHRAADLLTCSICPAGGTWSFHNTAGECNEENGFKDAGIIEDGVYTSSYGGGICQVATTVFNAVYEAGYYVDRRYNHTLYNSAYPAGRDAAVNWPDLDLIWSNSTDSDVLLTTWYTEGSITVALYGVDPEYSVSTYTSDWTEGEAYDTYYIIDESLSPKAYTVKTYGENGQSIYVDRTVTDKDGSEVSYQRFSSDYDPIDEVLYVGTEYEIPEDKKDHIKTDSE